MMEQNYSMFFMRLKKSWIGLSTHGKLMTWIKTGIQNANIRDDLKEKVVSSMLDLYHRRTAKAICHFSEARLVQYKMMQ
jgi:adenylate kinase family enzyme